MAEFVTLADGALLDEGSVAAFEVAGERIAVANVEGTHYAFDDLCPHRQCSLAEGHLKGTVVTCPCHGSQFAVTTGERLRGPAVRGVGTYTVRVDNGVLQVKI